MDGGAVAVEVWAGWTRWSGRDPFEDHCGPYHWRELDGGGWATGFTAAPHHMNGHGAMHGGCLMTFADYSLFVIARDALREHSSVTATFNAELVGTARVGERVECTGEVVKAGRSMVFVRGLVVNVTAGREPMMSFSAVIKKTGPRVDR